MTATVKAANLPEGSVVATRDAVFIKEWLLHETLILQGRELKKA